MRMLSLILWVPFFGAILVALLPAAQPRLIRGVALFHAGLALILSWSLLVPFDRSTAALQFVEQVVWSSTIGVSYALGVDGLSLPMVLLGTCLLYTSIPHPRRMPPMLATGRDPMLLERLTRHPHLRAWLGSKQ